jgi:hypothetical protein
MTNHIETREQSLRAGAPLYETLKLARSQAYRNTDHAIAEIVDNSLDAEAKTVQIILVEEEATNLRTTWQISEILVADNGMGMDIDTLDEALIISGSKSQNKEGKIGQFGYGLVYSSIYTCNRLDIWSWQDLGISGSIHTYIDMNELHNSQRSAHYLPIPRPIDQYILDCMLIDTTASGTVVRWSKLCNNTWKKGSTVMDKCENILGRIYRKRLQRAGIEGVQIFFTHVRRHRNGVISFETHKRDIRVSDPMYLLAPSNTPGIFGSRPMFESVEAPDEGIIDIVVNGSIIGRCHLSLSVVIKDSLFHDSGDERSAGAKPWGRHAFENRGISLVREGRELSLYPQLCKEPQDRWWGIEIEFGKELDDFFGVTSDKQQAVRFADCISEFSNRMASPKDLNEYIQQQTDAGDGDEQMVRLLHKLKDCRRYLLDMVLKYRSSNAGKPLGDPDTIADPSPQSIKDSVSAKASEARRRYFEQHPEERGPDQEITEASPEQIDKLREDLTAELVENPNNPDPETVFQIERLIRFNRSILIQSRNEDESEAFIIPKRFDLNVKACILNKAHPFYSEIFEALDLLTDGCGDALELRTDDEVKSLLVKATTALYVAFASWCELELKSIGQRKNELKDARQSWGQIARDFLISAGAYEPSQSEE